MNKIVDRLTGESILRVLFPQQGVSINSQSARSRRSIGRTRQHEQNLIGKREQTTRIGPGRNVDHRLRRSQPWISLQVMTGQRIMHQHVGIVAAEPVTPVVANSTLLSGSAGRFHDSRVRVKTKITLTQSDHIPRSHAGNFATKEAARSINPAVQSVFKTVDSSLKVMRCKPSEQFTDHISLPVSVRVFGIQNIGRGAY